MLRINKKIALTLPLLIVMIVALLFAYMHTWSTSAAESTDSSIYLHGPPLDPIHLNSNKTLTPIHMHTREIWQFEPGSPIYTPLTTPWEEIYPAEYDPFGGTEYHLTSWEDNGDGFLSPNDQIDMTDLDGNVTWYHVDRMTVTLLLSNLTGPPPPGPWPGPAEPILAIELKWEDYWPEIKYDYNLPPNLITTWHEVWPNYSNIYNLTSFLQDPLDPFPFRINPCDVVDLTDVNGTVTWWHVESVGTDLILREKIMDPKCTWWHEIYPSYSNWHHITSWESYPDPYCDRLSPKDQIDMVNQTSGITEWYFVDRVTVTLNVTWELDPTQWMKIELKTSYFEEMYEAFKHPEGTLWHEVYPVYSPIYNLVQWDFWLDDNCNGVLDVCDYIWLQNMSSPFLEVERYHVEDITYDLILNKKTTDPVCTDWHELYPNFSNWYHAINHSDEDTDGFLSPGDQIGLLNLSDATDADYHVDNVTLTLHVHSDIWGDFYIDLNATFEEMYLAKINPVDTWWINVYPYFDEWYTLTDWKDNCNGVLGYCDNVTLSDPLIPWSDTFHVEELSIDIVVTKKEGPPPPPPPPEMYWKPSFPDYAQSGMPDFDQRQDLWNASVPPYYWTWCAPTAVSNSLWWYDSAFHPSPLLTSYPGALGEHDPTNVMPFINHLAWLMDTDGQRTTATGHPALAHSGTWTWDIETGIAQYLSWSGVNPLGDVDGSGTVDMTDWDLVNAVFNGSMPFNIYADIWPETVTGPYTADGLVNFNDLQLVINNLNQTGQFYERTWMAPDFYEVETEVEQCEDVVLVLGFWFNPSPGIWIRAASDTPYTEMGLGHAVTVAGINSTTLKIAVSDPAVDAFEAGLTPGRSPVSHVHVPLGNATTHNNASLVSHDIYNVTFIAGNPAGTWALQGYVGNPAAGAPPGTIAVVEAAVITSPLAVHDVAVINVTTSKTGCLPVPTLSQGYNLTLNVTIQNQGNFAEPINGTVYLDLFTPIGDEVSIGVGPCNLPAGETTTLTVVWTTNSTTTKGNYTVTAVYYPVQGETETLDNTFTDGWIFVTLVGDVDGDRDVDVGDQRKVQLAMFSTPGTPNWNPNMDIDCDLDVDVGDQRKQQLHMFESW